MKGMMTRRSFLKKGSLVVAITAAGPMGLVNPDEGLASVKSFQPHAFVEIDPDDSVTVWVGQSNIGQGSHTGIAMIVAEELDADWDKVQSQMAMAADAFRNPKIFNWQITAGSTTFWHHHERFRHAGAVARQMLMEAAACRWNISPARLKTRDSKVIHPNGKTLRYGELVQDAAKLTVPEKTILKTPKQYRIIGTDRARHDIVEKTLGKTKFGLDFTVPNMSIAILAYPPRYNAKLTSYNEKAALSVKGVTNVVRIKGRIAVCAETTYAALQGREALNVEWSEGSHPNLSNETIDTVFTEHLQKATVAESEGNPEKDLAEAETIVSSTYKLPYISHAQVEPFNSTVHAEKDRCRIWVPTQGQTATLETVSKALNIPTAKIELMTLPAGGGFGVRSFEMETTEDAALISRQLGRPVQVVMTREDCFGYGQFRPACQAEIKAGLNKKGQITSWSHTIASQSIFSAVAPLAGVDDHGVDHFMIEGVDGMPYHFENFEIKTSKVDLPIPVTFWRSVGMSLNGPIVECFVDELAFTAGKDPVQFRLEHMDKKSRPYNVLSILADKVNWNGPVPKGRSRGVAVCQCFGSATAHMAEVSVDKKGNVTVHKIVCVIDCGDAIYPDQIRAQAEGGAIMGLSTTMYEEILFADGGVETSNYSDYPIVSMSEVPEIEVHIAESSYPPGGVGEPVYPTVSPAICNAIAKATGVRIRQLPVRPELLAKA